MTSKVTRASKTVLVADGTDNENEKLTLILNKLDEMCKIMKHQSDIIKKQSSMIEQQNNRIELLEKTTRLKNVNNESESDKYVCRNCSKNSPNKILITERNDTICKNEKQNQHNTTIDTIPRTLNDDQKEESQKKNQPKETRKTVVLKGTGKQNIGKFSAADKKAWLYIDNVNKEANENDIKIFLNDKFPSAKFEIEEIAKHEQNKSSNKSFKIGFDFSILSEMQNSEIWPKNVIVRRFKFFRQKY